MANIVTNQIYARKAHKNVLFAIENVLQHLGSQSLAFSEILPSWEEETRYPDVEWCEKNIGAKFAHVVFWDIDIEAGVLNVEIDSDWTPIRPFFIHLCQLMEQIDPDVELGMLYTDEFEHFDGHLIWAHGDFVVDTHNVAELVKLDEKRD